MERNFTVGQSNELLSGGKTYDLHNHYDFGGIMIASTGRACVWFTNNEAHGAGRPSIAIDIEGIDYLTMTSGVAMGKVRDLDEIGYKSPGDLDLDWLVGERSATGDNHLIFSFGTADFVRIHARSLLLRECSPLDTLRPL